MIYGEYLLDHNSLRMYGMSHGAEWWNFCGCTVCPLTLKGLISAIHQADQLGTKKIDEDGLLELIATLPGKESKEATPKQGKFMPSSLKSVC